MSDTIWSKAQEMLNRYGWQKNAYGDRYYGFCAVGALREAQDSLGLSWTSDAEEQLAVRVINHLGLQPRLIVRIAGHESVIMQTAKSAVTTWNDQPSRDKSEVVAVFQELHEKELAERGQLAQDGTG